MSNASDKIWYVRKGIKKLGPFSNAEMRGLASSGKLVPEDMIWKDGLDGWVKASKLKGVFPVQSQVQEVSPPPIESEPETSNVRSDTSSGSILIITTVIGLVVAIVGGGLIISSSQKRSTPPSILKTNNGGTVNMEIVKKSSDSVKTEDSIDKSEKSFSAFGVTFGENIKNVELSKNPIIDLTTDGFFFLTRMSVLTSNEGNSVNYQSKDIDSTPFTLYGKRNVNYNTCVISGKSSNNILGVTLCFKAMQDERIRNPTLNGNSDSINDAIEDLKRILLTLKEKYIQVDYEKESNEIFDFLTRETWVFKSKDFPNIRIVLAQEHRVPLPIHPVTGKINTTERATKRIVLTYMDSELIDAEYKRLHPKVDGL